MYRVHPQTGLIYENEGSLCKAEDQNTLFDLTYEYSSNDINNLLLKCFFLLSSFCLNFTVQTSKHSSFKKVRETPKLNTSPSDISKAKHTGKLHQNACKKPYENIMF